jgi:hypothetical protein
LGAIGRGMHFGRERLARADCIRQPLRSSTDFSANRPRMRMKLCLLASGSQGPEMRCTHELIMSHRCHSFVIHFSCSPARGSLCSPFTVAHVLRSPSWNYDLLRLFTNRNYLAFGNYQSSSSSADATELSGLLTRHRSCATTFVRTGPTGPDLPPHGAARYICVNSKTR